MGRYKIGFIGCGNMGSAILSGILSEGVVSPDEVIVSTNRAESAKVLGDKYGIMAVNDNKLAASASTLILAVKPNMFDEVIPEISEAVAEDTLIISVAAGQTISSIEEAFAKPIHLIRSMPNTPALVSEAMSALTANDNVLESEKAYALELFESFGQAEYVPEKLMDAVIGVSGSSPAYVYLFIEALADGAVAEGMPRDKAYKFAAQSVLGSAKMVLETGKHPGELKDAVCSPGGTTIEGVIALEEAGFRQAVIDGERACVRKSREMSK